MWAIFNIFLCLILVSVYALLIELPVYAGTLSCSVTTAAACTGTVIWRMSGATNAHAELPSQTTAAYSSNVVCCSGVTGLSNLCSGTFATALKLSSTTNAHVQQTGTYANSACISVPSGGSVSVAYQPTDCTTPILYDTTLGSMKATTNSHVGNTTAYTEYKICGTATGAAAPTISCSTNVATTNFGVLTSVSVTTAVPNASTTMSCANSASGCSLFVNDSGSGAQPGLWNALSSYLIKSPNAAFSATSSLVAGTDGYGIQATTTSAGTGAVLTIPARYLQSGVIVGGLATTTLTLASSTADVTSREVVVTHITTVSNTSISGSYSDTITYSCVLN